MLRRGRSRTLLLSFLAATLFLDPIRRIPWRTIVTAGDPAADGMLYTRETATGLWVGTTNLKYTLFYWNKQQKTSVEGYAHSMAETIHSREAEAPIVMQSLETPPPPPPQYHRRGSGVGTRFLSLQAETPIVMETPPPRQQRRGSVLGSSWRDEWPVGRAASYEWDDVQPQPEVPPTRFFV